MKGCIEHINNNWDTDYLFCVILDNCSKLVYRITGRN